jgi:pimeloyl-ACP methyl ester carboxylesterase
MAGQREGAGMDAVLDLAHPDDVTAVHARVLAGSTARSRYFEVSGRRVHAIEAGDGQPLVLLHGSGPSALLFLPLLERLMDVRAIAADRPGFGLSDPVETHRDYRDASVEFVGSMLDTLELGETALLGNSTGGTWVLWYALAHPERVRRLVLLGATPLLPATHVPPPMLAVAAPTDGQAPLQMPPPSPETVVRNMSVFGEAETIVNYPDQIDALVAAGHDRLASSVSIAELRTLISPTGWQPQLVVSPDELGALKVPTMLIWGDRDPLGGADAARTTATTFPQARLELLPAGHAPWLGHPDQIAGLVNAFIR